MTSKFEFSGPKYVDLGGHGYFSTSGRQFYDDFHISISKKKSGSKTPFLATCWFSSKLNSEYFFESTVEFVSKNHCHHDPQKIILTKKWPPTKHAGPKPSKIWDFAPCTNNAYESVGSPLGGQMPTASLLCGGRLTFRRANVYCVACVGGGASNSVIQASNS